MRCRWIPSGSSRACSRASSRTRRWKRGERSELKAYLSSGALAVGDVKEVFEDFVATTWKITMADGVVSDVEKQRLVEIVRELGIDASVLPAEWAKIVSDA